MTPERLVSNRKCENNRKNPERWRFQVERGAERADKAVRAESTRSTTKPEQYEEYGQYD